jgi:DNA-binding winged helix-turn-helix (wHTH) protein
MVEGEISFGRFRLDLARRELRRDQTLVRLGSRALDILCVLASAGGKVVTKEELLARVWGGVVVEEHNIQVHIAALRRALEEDGDGESRIVTVPGARLSAPASAGTARGRRACSQAEVAGSGQALARGAAVPQSEWRSRARIFRRRHGRGDHHRPFAYSVAVCHSPQFDLCLQKPER